MRKAIALVLTVVWLTAMVLAGCGKSSDTGSAQTSPASSETETKQNVQAAPTKLTLWTFVELHQKFYESMAQKWNQAHPNEQIQLEAVTYPYDDMHNKLLVALQSGVGAPDIADIEIGKFPNFMKGTPQLVELNDIVEPELPNIVKSRVDIYSKDGKYYGIDFHVGATVMYYNKELLDKAGVNPDSIKLWTDFEEAGKKVVAATGKPMLTLEVNGPWSFWPAISQQGSDLLDADGNVILDNETNIRTLEFFQKLVNEKIAIPAPGGDHHAEEYYGFMNKGGAAAVFMPFWYMGRFTEYMPDLKGKIIIRPMPAWKEGGYRSAGMGGTATTVTKQSKNIELAKKFVAYAKLSKEGNIEIWKQLGFDPIRTDVWNSPELKAPNKFTDYFGTDIFDTLLQVKDEIYPVNVREKTPAVFDAVRTKVMTATLLDGKNPAEVLKSVADELRKQ